MSIIRFLTLSVLSLILFSACSSDSSLSETWHEIDDNVFHGPADPDTSYDARGSYVWFNNRMNNEQVAHQLNDERPYSAIGAGGDETGDENMSFQP